MKINSGWVNVFPLKDMLYDGLRIYFQSLFCWGALTFAISSISNKHNVHFTVGVVLFHEKYPSSYISSIFVKINNSWTLLAFWLFTNPPMQFYFVTGNNMNIFIRQLLITWISCSLGIIIWRLILSLYNWNIKHFVLNNVDTNQ